MVSMFFFPLTFFLTKYLRNNLQIHTYLQGKPGPEPIACTNCTFRHAKCSNDRWFCKVTNPGTEDLQKSHEYDNQLRRAKADARRKAKIAEKRKKQVEER